MSAGVLERMAMKILTHPDNLELVKGLCDRGDFDYRGSFGHLYGIEIVTNPHMEREKWTGRYILPDGNSVSPNLVRVPDGRFFEWGNSDLEIKLLLEWGMIRKDMIPLFYAIREPLFHFDFGMTVKPPRYIVTGAV